MAAAQGISAKGTLFPTVSELNLTQLHTHVIHAASSKINEPQVQQWGTCTAKNSL